jgi:hypothetical protein
MTTQVNDVSLVWFRSVPGRAMPRFGTGQFLGCSRTAAGYTWATQPVAISLSEYTRHRREYDTAVRRGDLLRSDGPTSVLDETGPQGADRMKRSKRGRTLAKSPIDIDSDGDQNP